MLCTNSSAQTFYSLVLNVLLTPAVMMSTASEIVIFSNCRCYALLLDLSCFEL